MGLGHQSRLRSMILSTASNSSSPYLANAAMRPASHLSSSSNIWYPHPCTNALTGLRKRRAIIRSGGHARISWKEVMPSGIASDRKDQLTSLKWICEQSLDPKCIESLANHDPDIKPHVIEL